MSRGVKTSLVFAFSGIGIYLVGSIFASPRHVPEEFSEARIQGALSAERIVAASTHSLEVLKEIAALDAAGETSEALVLVFREINKLQDFQREALRLSSHLERMAFFLPQIEPGSARTVAVQGVSSQVAGVGQLLQYVEDLRELFRTLARKFQGQLPNADEEITKLLEKINEGARAINTFNVRFNDALADFDRIVSPR